MYFDSTKSLLIEISKLNTSAHLDEKIDRLADILDQWDAYTRELESKLMAMEMKHGQLVTMLKKYNKELDFLDEE